MKKVLTAILALIFSVSANAYALTVEEEIELLKQSISRLEQAPGGPSVEESLGLAIGVGGTFILQGTDKSNDGSDKGRHDSSYSIDIGIGKEFSNGGAVFALIETGAGLALDSSAETLSGLNGDADNNGSAISLTEFWYQHSLFNDKFTVTFGKIDGSGYLDENEIANDETAQFLNPAFINNPVIEFPDNNLGIRMTYAPLDIIDITYVYEAANDSWESFDTGAFNAVQVNIKPVKGGNYRLMYWGNNSVKEKFSNGDYAGGYGFSASIDQALSDIVSVFGRFGWQDPSVYEYEMAWSVGTQISGSLWKRENDKAGIAAGQIILSGDYTDALPALETGAELQGEVYYSFHITDNLALSPAIQYISNPMGGNAGDDNDLFIYGIRTQISF